MTSQIAPYFAGELKSMLNNLFDEYLLIFYYKPARYYSKCLFLNKTGMNKTTNLPFKKFPFYGKELHCRKISRGGLGRWVGERAQWQKGLAAQAQGREFKPPQLT